MDGAMSQYFEALISDESRDEMCNMRMRSILVAYLFNKPHSPWDIYLKNCILLGSS